MDLLLIIKLVFMAVIVYALYNTYVPRTIKAEVVKRLKKVKECFKKKYKRVKEYFKKAW